MFSIEQQEFELCNFGAQVISFQKMLSRSNATKMQSGQVRLLDLFEVTITLGIIF